jgi:DNA-binding protein HU-beta
MANKSELIEAIAAVTGESKVKADASLEAVFSAIESFLVKGEEVRLVGFGTFSVKETAARDGRNPATGALIKVDAGQKPIFKAGKALKIAVDAAFAAKAKA